MFNILEINIILLYYLTFELKKKRNYVRYFIEVETSQSIYFHSNEFMHE
jgi:hypothetical protein